MQSSRRVVSELLQLQRRPATRALRPACRHQQQRRILSSSGQRPIKGNPDQKTWWRATRYRGPAAISLLASGGLLSLFAGLSEPSNRASNEEDDKQEPTTDTRDPSLPRFRLSEIKQHHGDSETPWVTRGDKVYDITDWVAAHPGGDVILRAAGGSIDPYWDIFAIHKSAHVYEILAQYQIGFIHADDLVDGRPPAEKIEDPFGDDPARDPRLITMTEKPRNAETPLDGLAESFVTPNELFYVRNHMWVPTVADAGKHTLTIELMDGSTREYTIDELKAKFKTVTIAATLQCSGNRRSDMPDAQGIQWNVGAISCAVWEGVKLADVLADAGFPLAEAREGNTDARHVQFSGLESYGASIPLGPVLDPRGDVILAFSMNGAPLPRDHGFPLRALVPGHVAARSVKWLNKVVVSDEESHSQWQRRDYKLFGPNVTKPDWDDAPAIQETPVTSAITSVRLGDPAPASPDAPHGRHAALSGYAYAGGGRRIVRVDVSLDDGRTWDQARLLRDAEAPGPDLASQRNGHKSWAWQRWQYDGVVPLAEPAGDGRRCSTLVVKATDESYNAQPDGHGGIWNVRGNLANAWHRLKVCSDCQDPPTKGSEK